LKTAPKGPSAMTGGGGAEEAEGVGDAEI
jgi:hypothetical protein